MQQNMEKTKSLWSELHDHKKQIHPMHLGVFKPLHLAKIQVLYFLQVKKSSGQSAKTVQNCSKQICDPGQQNQS